MVDYNFWDIEWGPDEARGDKNLNRYFVSIPEYHDILNGKFRYIIGRKGTGKTAICENIELFASSNPLWFTDFLSLRDLPLSIVRDLRDRSYRDKSQFVPVWTFLILVALARLVLKDQGALPADAVRELEAFFKCNFPHAAYSFSDTLKTLEEKKAKIGVVASWLNLDAEKGNGRESFAEVHYQKASQMILDTLKKIQSDSVYFIFMDELDEGYRGGDQSLRLILLALLRATEHLSLVFQERGIKFRPILVLRSDIYDRLEDNDLNKLDDYVVRLRWHSQSTGGYSTRKLVDARIRASLTIPLTENAWESVVINSDPMMPDKIKDLWSYIANRTFERPRDILKFLKECHKIRSAGKLGWTEIKEAEFAYSRWFMNELRDEIHSHLSVWKEAVQCISKMGKRTFYTGDLAKEVSSDPKLCAWMEQEHSSPEKIISYLFDFGVIGNLDEHNRWLFKYKNEDILWNPKMKMILHFGFQKQLFIR